MKLTRAEIERVALLARLRLTAAEEDQLTEQLDNILAYMDKLNQIDTANVEAFSHRLHVTNVLREDRVTNQADADSLLANAPDRDGTFFKVPKILE
jgi:aspartyl-tRNA(Asn)/glutamyl-tRNA(Gln) amidotransferase subunit C